MQLGLCDPSSLGFELKSWLNPILVLGLFAYEHPACSICCHIKSERCFLKLLHVSTMDQYQIIVCWDRQGRAAVFPRAVSVFAMVSLTVTLVFPDKRNVIVSVRTSCLF